jgi:hypothetical protein
MERIHPGQPLADLGIVHEGLDGVPVESVSARAGTLLHVD